MKPCLACVPVLLLCGTFATLDVSAQVTRQSKLKQVPGCTCSKDTSVETSPNPGSAVAGQPFVISFDATQICQGQTIRDRSGNVLRHGQLGANVGTIKWGALAEDKLTDVFGSLSHTYVTAGTYVPEIKIDVQCYDSGYSCKQPKKSSECSAQGKSIVKVQ